MTYTPISKYVLEKVRKRSFSNEEDREYVAGISKLENLIRFGAGSWGGNLLFSHLRQEYPTEYEQICLELKPDEYYANIQARLAAKERLLEDKIALEAKRRKEELDYKQWWLSVGGRK